MDVTRRSLALDLLATDLEDPISIAALLAVHAVAPARRPHVLLPVPRPGESDLGLLGSVELAVPLTDGGVDLDFRPTPATVDAFLAGYVLMTRLFPHAFDQDTATSAADGALENPGPALYERSAAVANLLWGDLEALAGGLFGIALPIPLNRAMRGSYAPARNDEGLTSLRLAQTFVSQALRMPEAHHLGLDYVRLNIGLRQMDPGIALLIDMVLRKDVHQRLLLLRDQELAWRTTGPLELRSIHVDRGVLAAAVPETIAGAVLLDLVRTIAVDPSSAPCGQCGRPLLMSRSQEARVARGEAVYHKDACGAEHRRTYVRNYQRARATSRRAAVNSRSRLPLSTDGS